MSETDRDDAARRLLHRWFVEHNPLYLLSAALVLGGLTLVSREAARAGSVGGQLGVAAVSELYALALIGGAALLVRMGQRRAAVMLGLLVVLYLGDPTLHVETCAYLGVAGAFAAASWVALFAVKLHALAAALELRLSRSARLVPLAGAALLAVAPWLFRRLDDPLERGALVALAVYGIAAAAAHTHRRVTSRVGFDVRGVRCREGAWLLLGALGLAHVAYWGVAERVSLLPLLPAALLFGARWCRTERGVWALTGLTLAGVALLAPALFSPTAILASAALALRALRTPSWQIAPASASPEPPYRDGVAPPAPRPQRVFGRAPGAARLGLGALTAAYAAAWTVGWEGGAWPAHALVADLLLLVGTVALVASSRRWWLASPLGLALVHLAIEVGWIVPPKTTMGWGVGAVAGGFAMLAAGLLTSWRLGRDRVGRAEGAP